ncbi:hypothetical protein GCM10023144_36410 [Pigmentiphaga soli]|uniref:B12-binding domain-containing protein n=1 Tax=Pigmentiphaga soli TaxID=1007095 RepID=A0ABP8HG33_9BURK
MAGALADAGFTVHLGGLFARPDEVAAQARRLGVDALGVSSLAGAHLELFDALAVALCAAGIAGLPLVAGGVIPDADRSALARLGVAAVFGPGTPMERIVAELCALIGAFRSGLAAEDAGAPAGGLG